MLRYYQLLGLSNNASLDEIKRAYRRKSMKYHPDRNPSPDATRQFVEISTAYQALVNYKSSGYTPVYTAPPVYTPSQPKQYKNTRFTEEQMREARERFRRDRFKPLTKEEKRAELYVRIFKVFSGLVVIGMCLPIALIMIYWGIHEHPICFLVSIAAFSGMYKGIREIYIGIHKTPLKHRKKSYRAMRNRRF